MGGRGSRGQSAAMSSRGDRVAFAGAGNSVRGSIEAGGWRVRKARSAGVSITLCWNGASIQDSSGRDGVAAGCAWIGSLPEDRPICAAAAGAGGWLRLPPGGGSGSDWAGSAAFGGGLAWLGWLGGDGLVSGLVAAGGGDAGGCF